MEQCILPEPLRIVAGQRERVGLWMLASLPDVTQLPGGYEAIGVARGDQLVGGALYSDYRPCEGGGQIMIWAVGHGWLSRRIIRELLGYPLNQLGCHRLTACAARGNQKSRKLLTDLGFIEEGKVRRGIDTKRDMMIYGMLRAECRWLFNPRPTSAMLYVRNGLDSDAEVAR